ncbi:MAG: hypothetical protein HKL80_11480 [Acidimicrobiales bacterium]|nr:hypothetical protein [Acidimicrobiales bacterium]
MSSDKEAGNTIMSTGLPATGILSVVADITITNGSSANGGYLVVAPQLPAVPNSPHTSTINFNAGETISNEATVGLANGGLLNFEIVMGDNQPVNITVDVVGYYTSQVATGNTFVPLGTPSVMGDSLVSPCSLTANYPTTFNPLPISSGNNQENLTIVGADQMGTTCAASSSIPITSADNAVAVVLNVSVEDSSNGGALTIAPEGTYGSGLQSPSTSTIAFSANQWISNTVTVALSSGGITMISSNVSTIASLGIYVAVVGYFTTSSSDSIITPIAPSRIADSRCTTPSGFVTLPTSTSSSDVLNVVGTESITTDSTSCTTSGYAFPQTSVNTLTAVSLNVTLVNSGSQSGSVSVIEDGDSNLPYTIALPANAIISSNLIIGLPTSGSNAGKIVFTLSSSFTTLSKVDIIVDATAYFSSTSSSAFTSGSLYEPLQPGRLVVSGCSSTGIANTFGSSDPETLTLYSAPTYQSSCTSNGSDSSGLPTSASGMTAVILNVTVINNSSISGYLAVGPNASSSTYYSTIYFVANQIIARQVTVATSSLGTESFYSSVSSNSVTVDVDVEGYYVPSGTSGDSYVPLKPVRVVDSGNSCLLTSQISSGSHPAVSLGAALACYTGFSSGLPASGSNFVAVNLNLTVVNATSSGYLSVYADGSTRANTSSVNFTSSDNVSNEVTVAVPSNGQIDIYNGGSAGVDVIVDVEGWYASSSSNIAGDSFVPITPVRIADSRCPLPSGFTPANSTYGVSSTLVFTGSNSYEDYPGGCNLASPPMSGIPLNGVSAIVAGITEINSSSSATGYLAVYPGGSPTSTSTINFPSSGVESNEVTAELSGDSSITFYSHLASETSAKVDIVVDAEGYFVGSAKQIFNIAGTGVSGNSNSTTTHIATDQNLAGPGGVVVDAAGDTVFSDLVNNVVYKVNHAGIIQVIAGNGTGGYSGDGGAATSAKLDKPSGISAYTNASTLAADGSGDIFIADQQNCLVRKLTPNSSTNPVTYSINYVVGDVVSGTPVCSTAPAADGTVPTSAALGHIIGVTVDTSGDIFIADTDDCVIQEVTASLPSTPNINYGISSMIGGRIYTIAGTGTCGKNNSSGTGTSVELNSPTSVAVDSSGNVFIADKSNEVVWKLNPNGNILVYAGQLGTSGYSGDGGLATSAKLDNPLMVSVDYQNDLNSNIEDTPNGNLVITDYSNNRIRLVSNGVISTIVGNGSTSGGELNGQAMSVGATPVDATISPSGDLIYTDYNLLVTGGDYSVEEVPAIFANSAYTAASTSLSNVFTPGLQTSVQYNQETYGNSNVGNNWTSGDGSYSIELPSGEIVWLYSDSYFGTVNQDHTGNGMGTLQYVHNQVVVQDSSTSQVRQNIFVSGGTGQLVFNPSGLVNGNVPWVAGSQVITNSSNDYVLQTMIQAFNSSLILKQVFVCQINLGASGFMPSVLYTSGASENLTCTDVSQVAMYYVNFSCTSPSGTNFVGVLGESLIQSGGDTYLYGYEQCNSPAKGFMSIGKVTGEDLTNTSNWYICTSISAGSGTNPDSCITWVSSSYTTNVATLNDLTGGTRSTLVYGGGELSVTKVSANDYRLVSTDITTLEQYGYISTSPGLYGPFTRLIKIGQPEFGTLSPPAGLACYNDSGSKLQAYNMKEHPELENNGDIVISYNVIGCPPADNVDNYRPRFIVFGQA